ncbi:unnamed protein product [Peniophora sp. CBMAI 1063]|nr:unnamed protein product [Peniophora sp. CBMAI 1063]
MSGDSGSYTFRTTHNTAAYNSTGRRQKAASAPKHYVHNPGPRDRLVAPAGPSRPRVPNARVAWQPALRGEAAHDIWERANNRALQQSARASSQADAGELRGDTSQSSAVMLSAPPMNFAGMLDDLDGQTRVDSMGLPLPDDYEIGGATDARTSLGKVDYMRQFQERQLGPTYAQLIVVFLHAPPVELRCCICKRPNVARWRCGQCSVKRDFCCACLRQAHWNNPFHMIGFWTGKHYRKAWLRDAGVAIQLCPNAALGEGCPSVTCRGDFAAADSTVPPSYGSFTSYPQAAPAAPAADEPLTSVMNPDSTIHLPPDFEDLDQGEEEDVDFTGMPMEDDGYQPIGEDDGYSGDSADDVLGVARDGGRSSIPTKDLYGFRTLVIVHTDGLHGIGVGFCRCDGAPSEDQQLLKYGGLFPASPDRPSTAFTVQFLEYRHIDDVVCKTTPQAHMRKIRRVTESQEFRLAPNRYPEMLLVSRQYTAIKNLIDFGYASQLQANWKHPPAGGLVWKCIVCPRKSRDFNNLPKAWEADPDEWRKFVSLCYDGNFSGDHTISRNPGNNVPIYPGTGMFDHPDLVKAHSMRAVDDQDLRRIYPNLDESTVPCNRHKAASTAGKVRSKVVDIKGIGSWACSRHGCFCACGTNNFTLGESMDPVDKSLDSAFHQSITSQITRAQLLYDIWCRYGVHLQKRFKHSGLQWPKFRKLLQGVGVWHLYGHVFECHLRFSPSYSPRSGIVDGEILETLWSLLNAILQSCRGMSLAAREEKINMHMNDINYRKITGMGSLVRKYRKYSSELITRRRHLLRLELSCDEEDIVRWEQARRHLEEERVKDPYYADIFWDTPAPHSRKEATEVRLLEGDHSDIVAAIMTSLKLEQDGLRMQAQGPSWGESLSDRRTAAIARTRFNNRRISANHHLVEVLGTAAADEDQMLSGCLAKLLDEDEWGAEPSGRHDYNLRVKAEFRVVDLPSGRPHNRRLKAEMTRSEKQAMDIELDLRMGDMIDRLQAIREGLCDQAQGYRLEIRKKKGKGKTNYRDRTSAWIHVRQQTKDV